MASYYKTIKGKKYDRSLLDLADSVTSGKGDGLISQQDAKAIIKAVKDGGEYTDTEKSTVKYILSNFKFTDSAKKWFSEEIKKLAVSKKENPKKPSAKAAKKTVKKPASKKAAKKTAKKPAAKKAAPKKTAKAPAKKATPKKAAKKKAASKKATPKKAVAKPVETPEPAGTYAPSIPEPSPILQQKMKEEKEKKGGSLKMIIPLLVIALGAGYYFLSDRGGKPEKAAKISDTAPVKKAEVIKEKPAPVKEISSEKQDPVVPSVESVKIYFAKGSGWINHKERKKFTTIINYLKANRGRKLAIIGHACSLGNPKLNNDLSLYRSRNAARYLTKKGIDNSRLVIIGIGAKKPVKAGTLQGDLWQNRIIEFDVR